jgi:flavin reductase (DIM6/NTAB) family NADH-FMN oxidoreductase RutF
MTRDTTAIAAVIDPLVLRRAFGTFVTGVAIITSRDSAGNPRGMTANSFTSVSLDPPLVLICVAKSAASFSAFTASNCFAVNVLHESQVELSALFASKSPEKFRAVNHSPKHTGAPILTDSLTWFDCTVHETIDAGDHAIIIGRIQGFGTTGSAPLAFCKGRYARVAEPQPVGGLAAHDMIIAYLIETQEGLLLRADGTDRWALPMARQRKTDSRLTLDGGGTLALVPESTFLYSVFDAADRDVGYLIYRARLSGEAAQASWPAGLHVLPIDAIPYERVAPEQRAMLRRYVHERRRGRFGIYMDSDDGGRVAMIDGESRAWDSDVHDSFR